MRLSLLFATVVLASVTAACEDTVGPGADQFVVQGSTSATSDLVGIRDLSPSFFEVGMLEMRLTTNADCSEPFVTVFAGSTPTLFDFVAEPEIARVDDLPAGSYTCVAFRVSDHLRYRTAASEGACTSGTTYTQDIYRAGNEGVAFRDPSGAVITARGTTAAPVEDFVWAYNSTTPDAVTARGYSSNQVGLLASPLVVPGSTTFYWSAPILTGGATCEATHGTTGFR